MVAPVFIGDEVTAAGYRLAGAAVLTPDLSAVPETFEACRRGAELILMTAEFAQHIDAARLETAQRADRPLLVIVPDARNLTPIPDLEAELRAALGIEA